MSYDFSSEYPVEILKGVETLNVDIPANKEKFREFY